MQNRHWSYEDCVLNAMYDARDTIIKMLEGKMAGSDIETYVKLFLEGLDNSEEEAYEILDDIGLSKMELSALKEDIQEFTRYLEEKRDQSDWHACDEGR
jgi:hypothetical protein